MGISCIADMIGLVPVRIVHDEDDESICFFFGDGTSVEFYHEQDCCEQVYIADVNGNWNDLIGTPLLVVEHRSEDMSKDEEWGELIEWNFYCFRSIKGSVDVRWEGSSNGYYGVGVSMKVTHPDGKEEYHYG